MTARPAIRACTNATATVKTEAGQSMAVFLAMLCGLYLPSTWGNEPETVTWKEEFERICMQTEVAGTLPAEQLRKLISDSDKLIDRLSRIKDPQAKIYIFRLGSCREFFAYMLQLKVPERINTS